MCNVTTIRPVCLCPAESDTFSDGQTQRGMDRYLDSLFDPVLSDDGMVSVHTDVLQSAHSILILTMLRFSADSKLH